MQLCDTARMTTVLIAVVLYIAAATLLWRSTANGAGHHRAWIALAVVATLFHAETHVEAWQLLRGPDMHFFAALSLVGLGMGVPQAYVFVLAMLTGMGLFELLERRATQ